METKKKNEKDRISAVLFIVVFLLVVVIVIMVLKTVDDKRAAQQAQEQQTNTQTYQSIDQDPNALVIGTDGSVTPNPYEPVNALPGSGNNGNTGNTGNNGNNGNTGNTGNGGGQGTTTQPTTAPANNPAPAPVNNQPGNTNPQPGATTTDPGNANPQPGAATGTPTEPAPSEEQPFTPAVIGSGTFVSDSGTWLNIHADWSVKTISTSQIEVTVTVYADHQSLFTGAIDDSVGIQVDGQYVTYNSPKIDYDKNDPRSTELGSHTFTVDLAQGEARNISISVAWGYGGQYGSPNGRVRIDSLECGGTVAVTR